MSLLDNIILALDAIRANKLRTALTLLIIAFGITALVGILTSVDAIQASLSNNFATMGANNYDIVKKGTGVRIGKRGRRPKSYKAIDIEEALDFKRRYDYPAKTSLSFNAAGMIRVRHQEEKTDPEISIMGADENYLAIGGFEVEYGRNFSEREVNSGDNVVLVGTSIAKQLFKKPLNALGQSISVNNHKYRVIGVLASKGSSTIFNSDKMCMIPLTDARNKYATQNTTYKLTVQVDNAAQIEDAIAEGVGLMRNIRKLRFDEEDDFDITTSDKLSAQLIETSSYITSAATMIGIITLLGGAVGLMNIMLVSVTERIREIGISKAIGATRRTILLQFLAEAVVIGQLGGMLGIVLGIGAGNLVSVLLNGPFIIPWLWIFLGIVLCLIVGLVSGLYPAMKAASVDPIESLRYE